MKELHHFENQKIIASQLRSMIKVLKRDMADLEAEMAEIPKFKHNARSSQSAYLIVGRAIKERRDNLAKTIVTLEGKLTEIELTRSPKAAFLKRPLAVKRSRRSRLTQKATRCPRRR